MNTLEKLNKTITELETEVKNVKSLKALITEIEQINRTSKQFVDKINESINGLTQLEERYQKLTDENLNNREILNRTIDSIESNNVEVAIRQGEFFKNSLSAHASLEEMILNQIQSLKTENTRTLLELEKIMTSKLDRNKSDIEVELRKVTVLLEEKFSDAKADRMSESKRNKIYVGVIIACIILNLVISFFI